MGNRIGANKKTAFAVFLGLISFAIFFLLQTIKESVLSDAVPEIMQGSFFSTIYIYIHMAFLLNAVYFIVYYDYLFFSEIRKNSWYLLVKMRYSPVSMIFSKLFALLYSVVFIYSVGFVLIILLTFSLKYNVIFDYMPSLYFVGLIDLILLIIMTMAVSLFIKKVVNARYFIFISAVLIIYLKTVLGYYKVISNRVAMQNISNVLDISRSKFIPSAILILVVGGLICVVRAGNVSRFYTPAVSNLGLPEGARVVIRHPQSGKWKSVDGSRQERGGGIFDAVVTAGLIVIICLLLVFNALVIVINASTPGSEVAIRGIIPFVFKSNTMDPTIKLNDLAFFRKAESGYVAEKGQVILFRQNNVIFVERILEVNNGEFKADIDNYPAMAQKDAMLKTVKRQEIIGIYSGRSRWLGALILFANTMFGRLAFLLVPAVLLFYQKNILRFFRKRE
jgi:hypothetical protein